MRRGKGYVREEMALQCQLGHHRQEEVGVLCCACECLSAYDWSILCASCCSMSISYIGTSIFNMMTQCWKGKFANSEEDVIRPLGWDDEDIVCKHGLEPHRCGAQHDLEIWNESEKIQSVPLSPMDYVSAPAAEITFCMVFDKGSSLDKTRLKESLACALRDYPLFAGHIEPHNRGDVPESSRKGEQLRIINSNRGVKWTSRKACSSKHTLKRLLPFMHQIEGSKEFGIASMFRSPVMHPYYYKKVTDATTLWTKQEYLMRVFLTRLQDGCFVLVVTAAHLVTDLQPLKCFMKSWSNHYTNQDMNSKMDHKRVIPTAQEYLFKIGHKILADIPPHDDVYDHFNVKKEDEFVWLVPSNRIFRYPMLANLFHRPRVKGVHVSAAAIAEARTHAIQEMQTRGWCSDDEKAWVSDNDILTAIVWKAMAKKAKRKPECALLMACDMRKRVQGPSSPGDGHVPPDSLGNCVMSIHVGNIKYSDRIRPISKLAAQIRHAVNNFQPDAFVAGVAKATQILNNEQSPLVPYPSLNPDFLSVKPFKVKIPIMVTNWNFSKGFENEVNFGGNKPIWMEPGTLRTKVAVIMPSPSHIRGGGYIITLQLEDRDIYLERDYGLM